MKRLLLTGLLSAATLFTSLSQAEDYKIDTEGTHASINFKIQHLGYSWLLGRFNSFDGQFSFDENQPAQSSVQVVIQTNSIDSNHAERDKHLKGKDFLDVKQFPEARFTSTSYKKIDDTSGLLTGDFELRGITKSISFPVTKVGGGKDPWGGYRMGFEGKTTLTLADYDMNFDLGPASATLLLELYIEGIQQ